MVTTIYICVAFELLSVIGPPINHLVEKITLITENDQMYRSSVFALDRPVAMCVCGYVCMYVTL